MSHLSSPIYLHLENIQEDIAVLRDPCECPIRKALAGTGAITNAAMGISTIHGVGKAITSLPQVVRALGSSTPVEFLKGFAQSRGATYFPTSYIDDTGRTFANYRPPFTANIYVDPTRKSKLNLITSFLHELAHVEQGTGIAHQISAASTNTFNVPKLIAGYFLNPVEVNAAASAFGLGGNNFAILLANRGILDISNTIKYGSERGVDLANFLSAEYNQGLDYLCEQMGYE